MRKIKRCPLQKRIPRELLKNCGKYLGMILILVCTICIGSAFQSTLDGAIRYLQTIKEEHLQEDGLFEVTEKLKENEKSYYNEKKIDVYENFYVTDNSFVNQSKLLVFNERTDIDTPVVFEGQLPKQVDEIALDHVFARTNGIQVGDTVTVLKKKYTVSGTVSLPDYTGLFLNNTDLMMNTSHFCVAIVDSAAFHKFEEKKITYRYSYRLHNRKVSDADKASKAEEMQKHLIQMGMTVQNFLTASQNQSISFLEMDIGTDGPFMVVFVYMLVALLAFIFAILTNNTIEHEAVMIGTLLASGYKKSEILWHYLQPTLIVAVVGSIIGNVLGYTAMIPPFLDMYYSTYSVGPIDIQFSVSAFVSTTVIPVVIMVAINCIMLTRKLSLSPLQFLRHDLKKRKQKKAMKLPDFSFLSRFRIRVILQNKGSYVMLFIGIFLASFLLMFGIGLDPLMKHYTQTIDDSLPFNYQYILKAPVDTKQGEKMYIYDMDTWFSLGKKDIGVSLMGIDDDSTYFKGALAKQGVCISSALSKKMNLKKGDTITLKDTTKEKEYRLKIGGVYSYDAAMAVFMKRNELNDLLKNERNSYNSIVSKEKLNLDQNYVLKEISRADLIGSVDQMMDSFGTVILYINIFSVAVYAILMYILTKVVIEKNALSISFMKVFGYEPKEIRKLYLTTTTIVVIVSLVICIPVEIELFKLVLVFLSSMIEGYMEFYLPWKIYLEIIVIGIMTYFLINTFHIRAVNKIPMSEALKNRE